MAEPRFRFRVEDLLAASCALALVGYAGVKAVLESLDLLRINYWDLCYVAAPAGLIFFLAALRYALGDSGRSAGGVLAEGATIARDWLPFFFFLMTYAAFQARLWDVIVPVDRDRLLLSWDRRLFGESPAISIAAFTTPSLTLVLTLAYALHLVLPPVLAGIWYRRDRRTFRALLLAVLVAGILGTVGYLFVPAIGPGSAFPELFRVDPLGGDIYRNVTSLIDSARSPRDAFPSLHVGISSICLWFAFRRGRIAFLVALPLVLLNWFSTIYLRYHYLVDVLAGWAVAGLSVFLTARLLALEEKLFPGAAA